VQPINRYTRINKKKGALIFCTHCRTFRKVYNISTVNIICFKCEKEYPKNDFFELSSTDKADFEKQAHLLQSFYEGSLKTSAFYKRYKREKLKKGNKYPPIILRYIPEKYVLVNFLIDLSQKYDIPTNTLLKVIEKIDFSDTKIRNDNLLNCIIESCVFPLYECVLNVDAPEKQGIFFS